MSSSSTNRQLSVTRFQPEAQCAPTVDIDLQISLGATRLTFSLVTWDTGSRSKESLLDLIEIAYNNFVKAIKDEHSISGSSSKGTTG
jgi:hypothetical protein